MPPTAQETMVRVYRSNNAYQKDAAKLARQGWTVADVASRDPRSGCLRIVMLGGIGALVWRPKPELVVTYARPQG